MAGGVAQKWRNGFADFLQRIARGVGHFRLDVRNNTLILGKGLLSCALLRWQEDCCLTSKVLRRNASSRDLRLVPKSEQIGE